MHGKVKTAGNKETAHGCTKADSLQIHSVGAGDVAHVRVVQSFEMVSTKLPKGGQGDPRWVVHSNDKQKQIDALFLRQGHFHLRLEVSHLIYFGSNGFHLVPAVFFRDFLQVVDDTPEIWIAVDMFQDVVLKPSNLHAVG